MYSNSSSILALRAKASLHRHHHVDHCFSGDRRAERCGCCGGCCSPATTHSPCAAAAGFSDRGAFASPRFLYGYWLRQSALIRWAPSRMIISGGGGAARYRRLAAAWDGDPYAGGGWRRGSRCGGGGRVSCGGGVPDGSFLEVLALLAEVEECFGEDDGGFVDEEAFVKKRVGSRSYGALHRRICDDESNSSREGDIAARGSELGSSYQSTSSSFSSISGDSRRSKAFRRRGRDESSSSYGWDDEIAKKEVREVRKCEDDSRSRRRYHESDSIDKKSAVRIEDRKDNAASLADSVRRSREEYVRRDQRFTEQKESKEELQKVSKTSHVRQTSATGRNAGDKKVFSVVKEESSAADLLEEVRRQRNELEQLRKDYQNLLGTTQVHNVYDTKTSACCSVFNARVENLGETSALSIGLLEEVRRQRSEIEQLNENYQKLMRAYMMQESNMIRESNSMKTFGTIVENREDSSTSAVNLVEEGRMQYGNMDKQTIDDSRIASQRLTGTIELKKYRQTLKTSDNQESDVRRNSNYKKEQGTISENRERKAVSAINVVEEVQDHHTNITKDQQDIRHIHLGTSSHMLTERADIHSSNTETVSRSQRHYVTRRNDQQEGTSGAVKLSGEREEKVDNMNKKVSGHIDSSKNSQRLTDIVEIHKNDVTKALRTQDHVETTVKDQEESSPTVQHLVKLTRDERVQIDQRVIEEKYVSKDTRSHINISETFSGESDNANATFSDRGKDAVSTLNLVHEVQRQWNEDGKQARQQLRLRNDSQQRAPEFFEGGPVNASDSHMSSSTGTKSEDDYSSLVLVQERKEKEKINLVEETFGSSSGTSQSRYSPGTMQTHELDYHTKSDGFHLVKDDVLESVRRLDKSSSHYVGEFVDQLHQKVSASEETDTTSYNSPETQMEASQSSPLQKPMATAQNEDETRKKESLSQYSARSEVAGPSDEIWDVRGASSQEPSPTEEPEKDPSSVRILGTTSAPASSSGAIVKRSSKSLWSYIADIVRMGWRPNSSSQRSMLKSGTRSSSNESVNSDAWYSGHEQEDDQEENVKSGQIVTKKEPKLNKAAASKPHSRTSSVSGQVASEVPRQEERKMQVELGASIPMEIVGGSYGSNGSPPASSLENLVSVDGGKGIKGMPSAVATASPSALLGSTSVSNSEEETEIVHVAEVGFMKSDEEQKTERMSEVGGLEGKDVELKRRKLQRKKQVLREEFEEWEEAYKLETEQRKLDEIFMREALLEAKKAADMWEVPVGAVLVQDGKIIARGCNLVEDLRDSTAHAEMICIREASSLLRTWRLAGTTLYVTLEPCPMCAGAILQARIDVVVWGAPNKLLGADGSWVSLNYIRRTRKPSPRPLMASKSTTLSKTKDFLSTAASLAGSAVLLRAVVGDLLPDDLRDHVYAGVHKLFGNFSSDFTVVIEEFEGFTVNEIYEATRTYLAGRTSPSTRRVRVSKQPDENSVVVTIEEGEEVVDVFEGVQFRWCMVRRQGKNPSRHSDDSGTSEVRAFELTFHRKHKDKALGFYLQHIMNKSKAMRAEDKAIKLHMLTYDNWNAVNLDHPATFDTLALDPELKQTVMEDLRKFVDGKDYYRKVGRAWKRGYLLYGPPGTGKSSLIAAMANFLRFDIYDLELTEVHSNSTLRALLATTANRSVLVVEDIDCTIDACTVRSSDADGEAADFNNHNPDKVTLSGLLNFIDGLWSSCGEERIIVFTTNHKERLDPALLRPGRMDMHIHMGYCSPPAFRTLVSNYHGVDKHPLLGEIDRLLQEVEATPAEVAGELMKSGIADAALQALVAFLHEQKKAKAAKEEAKEEKGGDDLTVSTTVVE